jgi:hypothetical protein
VSDELVQISCDGCPRIFLSADALATLCAIKGPCPECGGRFTLDKVLRAGDPLRDAAPAQALS